eukprot:5322956-Amphidinium_carterae.1
MQGSTFKHCESLVPRCVQRYQLAVCHGTESCAKPRTRAEQRLWREALKLVTYSTRTALANAASPKQYAKKSPELYKEGRKAGNVRIVLPPLHSPCNKLRS